MTTAQVVETSVTVNNISPIQDDVPPDDQTQPTFLNMNTTEYLLNNRNCITSDSCTNSSQPNLNASVLNLI